ncbi:hypothetical protein [Symbioplanes lichenis]|uniref:hypothetical protein n=1 Tax=Symbioplanes lichenis TaxID=1629072 RepID=UPI0027385B4E|nr:hypothetical protein [Actinoplanes lichenis]
MDSQKRARVDRRSLLAGAGALALFPGAAGGHPAAARLPSHGGEPPVPPSIRSRQALQAGTARQELPLTQLATTYNYAQVVRWLDAEHFVVGRWDGTMSVFDFETAPFTGPMITEAVNNPAGQGVQMVTKLGRDALATSNDDRSLLLWRATGGSWTELRLRATVPYDPALGAATSGAWLAPTLVVGHSSGFLSLWSHDARAGTLRLATTIDVRNPAPVNPWGSHTIYGLTPLVAAGPGTTVVAGSDDGYVSVVRVPSGTVLSQTVFNPSAQRGINSVSVLGTKLLVANCSVGADDANLWYFTVDPATGALTLRDRVNLIIDPAEIQSFNFDVKWGRYSGGPCWFAGTEEGALWMGTADDTLHVLGHQGLGDGAIGAALDYAGGRLAAVVQNLFQFTTGA